MGTDPANPRQGPPPWTCLSGIGPAIPGFLNADVKGSPDGGGVLEGGECCRDFWWLIDNYHGFHSILVALGYSSKNGEGSPVGVLCFLVFC